MKVVIAGGTGLIGSAIAKRLTGEGHSVTILSRRPQPGGAAHVVLWDATSGGPWQEFLEGADAVINLTGESVGSRWTKAKKDRIVRSRVDATNAIVIAISRAEAKPKVLVNASAVGYYGNVEEVEVTENTSPGKDFLAQTSLLWEAAAMKAQAVGIRVAIMRTGFVIGQKAAAFKRMQLPFKLFAGGPFGSGMQWFPWIHIDDAAAGYVFAAQNENLSGPANLSAPSPVRVKQLAAELGEALHRPSFMPAPAFALKLILGEMSDLLLKGQQAIPAKLLDLGFSFRFPTLPEALKNVVG